MLKRSFLFNAFLAILIVAGLLFLFFNSLDWLTNHGKQTVVPNLMGKKMDIAIRELKNQGFQIKIDSTYKGYKDPLEVLFQEPEAGMSVKLGRTIFITVNRKTAPSIEMPNLVNMSFRNALLTMRSYSLEMGDTTYRPDVAAGAVLEQWLKGKQIAPGMMVPFGSRIDLVVGEGLSGEQDVPNLIGMSWLEAKTILDSLHLSANAMWEGSISDSAHAIVYMQQPEALNELDFKNSIPEGDIVDIRIMQSPSQDVLNKNQPGSKKLMGEDASIDSTQPAEIAPASKKELPDSLKKKKIVPGMNVREAPIAPQQIASHTNSKNSQASHTNSSSKSVDTKTPTKPHHPKPAKPKSTATKPAGEKHNDDKISTEYN